MTGALAIELAAACGSFTVEDDAPTTVAVDAGDPPSDAPSERARDATLDGDGGGGGGRTYVAEVLADGPILYYRLGEAVGSGSAADQSNAAKNGSYDQVSLGRPGAIVGDPDTAAQFGGAAELTIPASAMPDFAGRVPYTIEVWAKPGQMTTEFPHLVSKESDTKDGRQGYALFIQDSAGYAFERYRDGANTGKVVMPSAPTVGAFSHVVGTFDGAALVLYLNGQVTASGADAKDLLAQPGREGRVGAGPGEVHFPGVLDEVAIYDKALGAERVLAHYRAGSTRTALPP